MYVISIWGGRRGIRAGRQKASHAAE